VSTPSAQPQSGSREAPAPPPPLCAFGFGFPRNRTQDTAASSLIFTLHHFAESLSRCSLSLARRSVLSACRPSRRALSLAHSCAPTVRSSVLSRSLARSHAQVGHGAHLHATPPCRSPRMPHHPCVVPNRRAARTLMKVMSCHVLSCPLMATRPCVADYSCLALLRCVAGRGCSRISKRALSCRRRPCHRAPLLCLLLARARRAHHWSALLPPPRRLR
jgi:hypothetical protein